MRAQTIFQKYIDEEYRYLHLVLQRKNQAFLSETQMFADFFLLFFLNLDHLPLALAYF